MSLFLISFFLIYGGVHVYIYLKVRAALVPGPLAGLLLGMFLAAVVVAPVVVRFAERQGHHGLAQALSWGGYLWMGFAFLFFSSSLLVDAYRLAVHLAGLVLRREIAHLAPSAGLSFYLPFIVAACMAAYGYHEALDIRVERVTLKTGKLPAGTERLTVAQISDVHLGIIVREARLSRILETVRRENPDVLVSTGDLVDGQIDGLDGLSDLFSGIRPRYGKYAVTGNHEFYSGLDQALAFTAKAGFRILRGEGEAPGGLLNIAGVDDPAGVGIGRGKADGEKELLASLPPDRFTIFLKHRPVVDRDSLGLFDLQMSGHTHRGQIFPFNLLIRFFYPGNSGLNDLGRSHLYVNRGAGTWGPPIRFLSPPEVTMYEILRDDGR